MRLWGWRRERHPRLELLSCYLDNQVSSEERCQIEEHLAICAECREVVNDLRRVSQWMKTLPQEEPSHPVQVAPAPARPTARLALPPWAVPTAVATALLLVVLVATDLSLGLQARQTSPLPPPGAAAVHPGQALPVLTPDIPKEAGQAPQTPASTAPASPQPPTPRPLLHWAAWELALAGAVALFLAAARLLRRPTP